MATKSELCIACQECCKHISFVIPANAETLYFYKVRGYRIILTAFNEAFIVIPSVCQHLTPKGCAIYSSRPKGCEAYDGSKSITMKDKCLWPKEDGDESK
jgi:Fe-S-cluster containining protein